MGASRCAVYIGGYCFWSVSLLTGRSTALSPVRKTACFTLFPDNLDSLTLLSVSFNKGQKKRFRFRKPHSFCEVLAFAYYYLAWFYVLIQNSGNKITQQIVWKFQMCCFNLTNRYTQRHLQMGITFKYGASPFLTDKKLELVGSGLKGSN